MADMSGGIIQLSTVVNHLYGGDKAFAQSLIDFFQAKGRLSDRQAYHIPRLLEKAENNQKPKPVTQVSNFHRIIQIFDTAREHKHKTPKVRLGDAKVGKVVLSEAPANGINAGMIYVKQNDEYKGKIDRNGGYQKFNNPDDSLIEALSEFALDPLNIMKKYGFATGTCSCCGRKLTDKTSIANGIGPICAENFGF